MLFVSPALRRRAFSEGDFSHWCPNRRYSQLGWFQAMNFAMVSKMLRFDERTRTYTNYVAIGQGGVDDGDLVGWSL